MEDLGLRRRRLHGVGGRWARAMARFDAVRVGWCSVQWQQRLAGSYLSLPVRDWYRFIPRTRPPGRPPQQDQVKGITTMFKVRKGLVPLAVTGLVVAGLLSGCAGQQLTWGQDASAPAPSSSSSAPATPSPSASPGVTLKDANAAVTVKPGDLNWTYPDRYIQLIKDAPVALGFSTMPVDRVNKKGEVVGKDVIPVFQTASTQPTIGEYPRLYTDAVAPAWCGSSVEATTTCILVYPDYGAQVCTFLYNTPAFHTAVGDISLAENNPWMEDCGSDIAYVNDWAGHAESANTAGLVQYAKTLAKVAEVFNLLIQTGTGDGTPVLDYHLAVVGPNNALTVNVYAAVGATIPEFEIGPQYTGQWRFMNISIKGLQVGCDPIGINIGFGGIVDKHGNGGDGRFARFACPPPPSAPPTYTPPPSGPGCTYGLNPDGECIPPKVADPNQTHPTAKPVAPETPVKPVQPYVDPNPPVVVVPQVDQAGGGNGHIEG